LIKFLRKSKVPVVDVGIGHVTKHIAMKAVLPLLQMDGRPIQREYATILAFNVKIIPEA